MPAADRPLLESMAEEPLRSMLWSCATLGEACSFLDMGLPDLPDDPQELEKVVKDFWEKLFGVDASVV